MENQDSKLLMEIILDVKNDVASIKRDLNDVKEMTYTNSIVLDEHARRSEASEARLDVQEEKLEKFMEKMEPVQDHVRVVAGLTTGLLTLLKILGGILGLLGSILGLMKWFR